MTTRTSRPAEGQTRTSKEERPERIPVSGQRNLINVRGIDTDKYVVRWVNDTEDRIRMFERGGWEKVTEDVGIGDRTADSSNQKQSFATKYMGANVTAYLMKIKREWYEEDQASKARLIKEQEDELLRQHREEEGRYGTGARVKRER